MLLSSLFSEIRILVKQIPSQWTEKQQKQTTAEEEENESEKSVMNFLLDYYDTEIEVSIELSSKTDFFLFPVIPSQSHYLLSILFAHILNAIRSKEREGERWAKSESG